MFFLKRKSIHKIHVFDNGVRVHDKFLIPAQRKRYAKHNVHEAEEEELFIDFVKKLRPGSIYVNIGAAIGYYPLLAQKLNSFLEIHAIEPLERHIDHFKSNIHLNDFLESNFNIHEFGVDEVPGELVFVDNGYGSYIEAGNLDLKWRDRKKEKIKIRTTSIDEFVSALKKPIALMQMDIQGLEGRALAGARHSLKTMAIKCIMLGTHSKSLHLECLSILKEYGYRILVDNYTTIHQPDGILMAEIG